MDKKSFPPHDMAHARATSVAGFAAPENNVAPQNSSEECRIESAVPPLLSLSPLNSLA